MGEATTLRPAHEEKVTVPAGGYQSGQVVQAPSGRAAVVQGLRDLEEGETATLVTCGQKEVACGSATVLSAGVLVDFDDTNNLVVATTTGNFALGRLARAKANGETTALVILNDL